MKTGYIRIENHIGDRELERLLEPAAKIIKAGGLVAFPTETVYGLGADALNPEAAARIYEAKGRPGDNPLIVHISDLTELEGIADEVPSEALLLASCFWPGPLTMILKKGIRVPYTTSGGLDTVAVRMPDSRIARALIRLSGRPVAAPSANTSGRPSPTRAEHVAEDMDGRVEMIVDGGEVGIGLESTIIDLTGDKPVLLRPGAITPGMLSELLGEISLDDAIIKPVSDEVHPKAPGMKYRHYAPKAKLTIVSGDDAKVIEYINKNSGENTGIIASEENAGFYTSGIVRAAGSRADEDRIAHNLFAILREFDGLGVDRIYSESFESEGLGQAIMNRLIKAAGHDIVHLF